LRGREASELTLRARTRSVRANLICEDAKRPSYLISRGREASERPLKIKWPFLKSTPRKVTIVLKFIVAIFINKLINGLQNITSLEILKKIIVVNSRINRCILSIWLWRTIYHILKTFPSLLDYLPMILMFLFSFSNKYLIITKYQLFSFSLKFWWIIIVICLI
jgi:hypothetical protein